MPDSSKRIAYVRQPFGKGVIALCATAAVVVLGLSQAGTLQSTQPQHVFVEAEVVRYSTSTPSEERPPDNYAWRGQAHDPKKITVPRADIRGFVQNIGIDQNSELAVPNNIFFAGWFVDSVRPGDPGLSIIDGHVDGVNGSGLFYNLKNITVGDTIEIESGNGTVTVFRVFATHTIRTEQAAAYLFNQEPRVASQLNLITCTGTFDQTSKSYDERVVVYSELIQ